MATTEVFMGNSKHPSELFGRQGRKQKTGRLSHAGFPYFFRTACSGMQEKEDKLLIYMVGGAGFEPATLAV